MTSPANKREHDGGDKSNGPASKSFKTSFDDTIVVLVGSNMTRFTIHKNIACAKSPFFKAACSMQWSEGQEGVVRLPEHRAATFEVFVHWIYSDKLDVTSLLQQDSDIFRHQSLLKRLWMLGNYLQCGAFCNMAIDRAIECLRRNPRFWPSGEYIMELPDGTMRRLSVDIMVWRCSIEKLEKWPEAWPDEVMNELARKFMAGEAKEDSTPLKKDRCYYHEHKEEERCGDGNKSS